MRSSTVLALFAVVFASSTIAAPAPQATDSVDGEAVAGVPAVPGLSSTGEGANAYATAAPNGTTDFTPSNFLQGVSFSALPVVETSSGFASAPTSTSST